jgi:hypothetical protein
MKKSRLLPLLLMLLLLVGAFDQAFSQGQSDANRMNVWELMQRRDLRLQEIDAIAKRYFDAVGKERGTGYKQYERWKYEQQFHLDENGYILPEGFDQQQYEMTAPETQSASTGWTEIGPTYWNRTSGWNPGVGRITSIAVSPSNPSFIYICTPGGGMWKSTQGGNQWIPLADYDNSMMNMFAVAVHPTNPNLVYAGKSNGQVVKSSDGGNTWTAASTGAGTIWKIAFHPADPSIMFAVGTSGISKSINGGTSFTLKSNVMTEDIEFLPSNPNVLIASDNVIQRSIDGGETWATLGSAQGVNFSARTLVSVSPASPSRVYAVQASGNLFGRLLRSDDGGASFYVTVTGDPALGTNYFGYETTGRGTTGQAGYDMAMTVNPKNADEVHIAGIICWKSTNGGSSFVPTTAWSLPNSIGYNHADVHVLEWVGNAIYSGSDGGIYKSTDFADNWTDLTRGLGIRQFYRISNSKTNPALVMGGAQDNGTSIYKSTGWIDWLGADGMDCIVSPLDANLIWGTSQNGSLYRTSNGGSSYSSISEPATGNWVTPVAIENNSNTIYAGWNGVYRSTDLGVTWTKISGTTITSNLNTLAVSPSNPQYIYASVGSTLYVTKNGGSSWLTFPTAGTIAQVGIHPTNPEKIWIASSAASTRLLYSENAGETITNISTGLPNLSARSVAVENSSSDGIYVAMNLGVYYKNNLMTSWVNLTENLPLVAINEVEIVPNADKIRIGTYGRGIWERSVYLSCPSPSGLNTTLVSPTSATLTWQPVIGASGYLVEYKLNSSTTWTLAAASTSLTSLTLSDLSQESTYQWRVSSLCGTGTSTTTESQFTTGASCPVPIGLQTGSITKTSANLTWTAVTGASTYEVEYRSIGSTTWLPWASGISANQIELTGLLEGTGYEWRVRASCSAEFGNYAQAQFTTAITCLPPSNLQTTAITAASAQVNWTGVTGATGYDLEFRPLGASNWILLGTNISGTSFGLTALSGETTYEWRVRTTCGNLSGSSDFVLSSFTTQVQVCPDPYESNETRATAKLIGTTPITARIGNITDQDWFEVRIGSGKSTNIRVSLSNLPSNTYLFLYNATGTLVASSQQNGGSGQIAIFNSSTNRTSYFIQVRGDGTSFSNNCYTLLAETSTQAYTNPLACNPPSGLNATNVDLSSATINWSAVTGGLSYQVEYKLSTSSTWLVSATQAQSTSLTLSGLVEGQVYDWRVRTNCSASSSSYAQSSFTTASSSCVDSYENNNTRGEAKTISTGIGISATISHSGDEDWFAFTSGKGKTANLRITLDGLPVNLDLYFYNSSGQLIGTSTNAGINPEQIVFNNAVTNSTYFVRVISATGENSSSCYRLLVENNNRAYPVAFRELSDEIFEQLETTNPLVMVENEAVRLYPNPTKDKIHLEFYSPIAHAALVELLDPSGKVVRAVNAEVVKGENLIILEVNREKPGLYLLRLQSNRTLLNRKIIIQ